MRGRQHSAQAADPFLSSLATSPSARHRLAHFTQALKGPSVHCRWCAGGGMGGSSLCNKVVPLFSLRLPQFCAGSPLHKRRGGKLQSFHNKNIASSIASQLLTVVQAVRGAGGGVGGAGCLPGRRAPSRLAADRSAGGRAAPLRGAAGQPLSGRHLMRRRVRVRWRGEGRVAPCAIEMHDGQPHHGRHLRRRGPRE